MKKIIINIGRQFGAGGKSVADILGKKLGIPVYDRELLAKAAKDNGFSETVFENSDEKKRNFFLSFSNGFGDDEVFKMQSHTIRDIASKGSAIIVGRCANYILRDLDCCLNVFLTSPMSVRAQRVMEREGISEDKVQDYILKKEEGRKDYYNYYTFGNWGVASTYDLCVDSSLLGIERTADFIINFANLAGKL